MSASGSMEAVKSHIFNIFSGESLSSSPSEHGQKFLSKEELAKRFESRRKAKRRPTIFKRGKERPIEMSRKPKKLSIRALLRQKAESSLAQLAIKKSSQQREVESQEKRKEGKTFSPRPDPREKDFSKERDYQHQVQQVRSAQETEKNSTSSTRVNKNLIVVREWDGQSNSYLMNLNVKAQARVPDI